MIPMIRIYLLYLQTVLIIAVPGIMIYRGERATFVNYI